MPYFVTQQCTFVTKFGAFHSPNSSRIDGSIIVIVAPRKRLHHGSLLTAGTSGSIPGEPCVIHCGRSGTGAGYCPSFFIIPPLTIIPPCSILIYHRRLRSGIVLIRQHLIRSSVFKLGGASCLTRHLGGCRVRKIFLHHEIEQAILLSRAPVSG
jgi:hypothetical protein